MRKKTMRFQSSFALLVVLVAQAWSTVPAAAVDVFVTASPGQPYGVATIEIPVDAPVVGKALPPVRTTDEAGRVLYPISHDVRVAVTRVSDRPVPQPGRGRLLGRVTDLIRELASNEQNLEQTVARRVSFLFLGSQPLRIRLEDSRGEIGTYDVVPKENPRDHAESLQTWWNNYTDATKRQMDAAAYPACAETYLVAIDPRDHSRWILAVASGGVWKTENAGVTFKPVFDSHGAYSIGCVAIAPTNSLTVWVGTGENNSQRSVGYGDGVYKSIDGGDTFKKVGLEKTEHIGKILIHPEDENTVYVAAQGPLWNKGGERGLYKTTDGGKYLGAHPAYQRTHRCQRGRIRPARPGRDLRRGLPAPPARFHPDQRRPGIRHPQVGSTVARTGRKAEEGPAQAVTSAASALRFLRLSPTSSTRWSKPARRAASIAPTNAGATWHKQGDYNTQSAQYYQEIFCRPQGRRPRLRRWTPG